MASCIMSCRIVSCLAMSCFTMPCQRVFCFHFVPLWWKSAVERRVKFRPSKKKKVRLVFLFCLKTTRVVLSPSKTQTSCYIAQPGYNNAIGAANFQNTKKTKKAHTHKHTRPLVIALFVSMAAPPCFVFETQLTRPTATTVTILPRSLPL